MGVRSAPPSAVCPLKLHHICKRLVIHFFNLALAASCHNYCMQETTARLHCTATILTMQLLEALYMSSISLKHHTCTSTGILTQKVPYMYSHTHHLSPPCAVCPITPTCLPMSCYLHWPHLFITTVPMKPQLDCNAPRQFYNH